MPSVILRFRKLKKNVASIGSKVKARKPKIQGDRNNIPALNSRRAIGGRPRIDLKDGIALRIFESSSIMGRSLSYRLTERFRRVSLKLTRLNYTRTNLLVVNHSEVVNQLLELGLEVEALRVSQQTKESRPAIVGFDGIRLVLFGTWGIRISQTLYKHIPAFLCHKRILFALLSEEGFSLGCVRRHGSIHRKKLVGAGGDQIGQNFEGCVRVRSAFPDAEGICINTPLHFAIGSYGLNAELEFITRLYQLGETTSVPGLGQAHCDPAGIEWVAGAKLWRASQSSRADEGLFTPHAIIEPLEPFLPAIRDGGFITALGIARVQLGGATIKSADGLNRLKLRLKTQLYDLGGVKVRRSGIITVHIHCQAFGNFGDRFPVPIHFLTIQRVFLAIRLGRIFKASLIEQGGEEIHSAREDGEGQTDLAFFGLIELDQRRVEDGGIEP